MKPIQKIFLLFLLLASAGVGAQVNNISINEIPEELEKKAVLVDVRTPEEFNDGHLPGALNIDIYDEKFIARMASIRKGKAVLLYCRSGKRSADAAHKLDSLGYRKVYNLEGGYIAWSEKNKQ